jgi:hypothetical protein
MRQDCYENHKYTQLEVAYDKAGDSLNDPISKWPEDQGVYGIDGLTSALILRLEPKARC